MGRPRSFTDTELSKAVGRSRSWAEVLRTLGLTQAGGTQANIIKTAERLDLDTSHFSGQGWTAGRTFPERRKATLERHLKKNHKVKSHSLRLLLIETGERKAKCEQCGRKTWNGEAIPLELHHVDGDKLNNLLENLMILCPNCHAQTPNHAGKGKRRK